MGWPTTVRRLALALAPAVALAPAAQAAPAPGRALSYLLAHNDQLKVPGHPEPAAITPGGRVYTGWGELVLRVGGGREMDPRSHRLEDGRVPILRMSRVDGGVAYTLTLLAASVSGHPTVFARVEARNQRARPNRARVSAAFTYDGAQLTPRVRTCCIRTYRFPRARFPPRDGQYFQPGVGLDRGWRYDFAGRGVLVRDGQAVLFYAPPGGARLRQSLGPEPGGGDDFPYDAEWGRSDYELRLPAHGRRQLDFRMPIEPVARGSRHYGAVARARFPAHRRQVIQYYRRLFATAARISVPETKVTDTYYASLAHMALPRFVSRGRYIQPVNALRYHAFWLRDGAVISRAFDLAGLHRVARQNLEYFFTWQQADGLFLSRPEEYDGFGQTLWAFAEHHRLARDRGFARRAYPAVRRAMAWFEAQRARDPLGMLPPVTAPRDNDLIGGHVTGDNLWAAAGVSGAVELARAVGDHRSAARWRALLQTFKVDLRRHVTARAPRGPLPPALDRSGGQVWGILWGSYIGDVFPADGEVMRNTIRRARRAFAEGIMTYLDRRLLHHYSGFRVFQTDLLANRQRDAVRGLYAELAHTTGTNAGWEAATAPYGDRVIDDATTPHGWWAAEYVTLLRNMLVREQGSDVYLMSALSPSWLRPGRVVSVRDAPTAHGPVSFTLRARAGGAELSWSARVRSGTRLRWPAPYGARGLGARAITLPGRRGRLSVRWRLTGESPTFSGEFARLMRAYARSRNGATERVARAQALEDAYARRAGDADLDRYVPLGQALAER